MAGSGEFKHKQKNSDPTFKLAEGQKDFFQKNVKDVTKTQQQKIDNHSRFMTKRKSQIYKSKPENGLKRKSVDRAFCNAMEKNAKKGSYNRIYDNYRNGKKETSFPLKASRGARYMLSGEDVLELDFGGTGANELMRGALDEYYVDPDDKTEQLPFEPKEKTGTWGKIWRPVLSLFPGVWSTKENDAYVDKYNKQAQKNREAYEEAYGQPVTLEQNGKRKTFKYIKRKDSKNTATGAEKTRYTMAGPNLFNIGEYDMEHLEEYALTLGSEWLYPKLMDIALRVGDGEVPPDTRKLHVMLQGHSRGAVAASMAAMRLNKWIYDNFEEKIARLVQFDIVQLDPVPGKFSRTGIREKADLDSNSYYDSDGKVTTDAGKAKYRSLRDQQNSTVIYTLRTFNNHLFTPQQIHGAKRVILSVRDHNTINSYEPTNKQDRDATTHRSPYLDLESNTAFRGSGVNDMEEGLYFADNLNVLHRVRSLKEYQMMCTALLHGAPEKVQTKRQYALDQVAEYWFETHKGKPEKIEDPVQERLQRLQDKQKSLEKNMSADSLKGWEILENDQGTAPLEDRRDIKDIDSFVVLTHEEYDAKTKAEQKKYKQELKKHEKRVREALKKGMLREKEALLRSKTDKEAQAARKEAERKQEDQRKKREQERIAAAKKEQDKADRLIWSEQADYLRTRKDLEQIHRQIAQAADEEYKKLLIESFLVGAARALLEHKKFGRDLQIKNNPEFNDSRSRCVAYKLAMAELGAEDGQKAIHKDLESFTVGYTSYDEPMLLSNIINNDILNILPDIVGEDPLYKSMAAVIHDRVLEGIAGVEAGWKEYETRLPESIGMSADSDFIDDYMDPLVQKQFTDQVQDLMKKKNITRPKAEQEILARRRKEFESKPDELTKKDSLIPVISQAKADELSEKQGLYRGITDKDWESKGGCSYNYVLNTKEAERIVKKSDGFLCASKLKTAPGETPVAGVRVLRPSLPEKMKIGNKEIPVRRTYNLFMKTFVSLITNPDGSFNVSGDYEPVIDIFDEISSMIPLMRNNDRDLMQGKLTVLFLPKMREILKEKYITKELEEAIHDEGLSEEERRKAGTTYSDLIARVMAESTQACEDILDIVFNIQSRRLFPDEIATLNIVNILEYLIRFRPEQIIAQIREMTFGGIKPTDMEIIKAVEGVYADIESCFAALKSVRDLDIDGEEVPVPNACSANAPFVFGFKNINREKKDNDYIRYTNKAYILAKPEKVRQYLIKNMDNLAASVDLREGEKLGYLKTLNDMDFKDQSFTDIYDKDMPHVDKYIDQLSPQIQELVRIAMNFTNYEYHQAACIISDDEDGTWTTEAFAAEDAQLVVEPLTFHAGVGHYSGRKNSFENKGINMHQVEGFNNFYNSDLPISADMVDAIKKQIKRMVFQRQLKIPEEDIKAIRAGKKPGTLDLQISDEPKAKEEPVVDAKPKTEIGKDEKDVNLPIIAEDGRSEFAEEEEEENLNEIRTTSNRINIIRDEKPDNTRNAGKKNKAPAGIAGQNVNVSAQRAWDDRYVIEGADKYYISDANKTYYAVGTDEAAWEKHATDRVVYGFTSEELEGITEEELILRWKGKFANRPDGFVPTTDDIQAIRRAYLNEYLTEEELEIYSESLVGGEDSGMTLRLIKDKGLWDMYHLLDLTREYHVYMQHKDQIRMRQLEHMGLREPVMMTSALPKGHYEYESQKGANCYACAGAKIVNHLTGEKLLDQYKIRGFVPRYLSQSELIAQGNNLDSKRGRQDINLFAGKKKIEYGNFFSVSDVIFDKKGNGGLGRRDIAVHKCTFGLDDKRPHNVNMNLIEVMKEKLHSVISSGQPVAFLCKKHYVTITGLDGNRITYLDSQYTDPKPVTKDIFKFLDEHGGRRGFDTVELNWASKITPQSLQDIKNEYGGPSIDEQTGEMKRTVALQEYEDVAHRTGIVIHKTGDMIEAEGYGDVAHFMTEAVCMHRGAFMTDAQLRAWEARDDKAWAAAQKEMDNEPDDLIMMSGQPILIGTKKPVQQKKGPEKKEQIPPEKEKEKEKDKEKEKEKGGEKGAEKEKEKEQDKEKPEVIIEKIEKKPEVQEDTQVGRLTKLRKDAELKEGALLRKIKKIRLKVSGEAHSGIELDPERAFLTSLRCMQMFEPGVSEDKLCMRFVEMAWTRDKKKDAALQNIEFSRKACLMESLIGKILSFDIHKEFTAKDKKGKIALFHKYEPLFSLADQRDHFINNLSALRKGRGALVALSEQDIRDAKLYLMQIDEYGKYYTSLIEGDEPGEKTKEPDPEKRLVSDERREQIATEISKKWTGFEESAAPILQYVRATDALNIRDGALEDRMKIALRDYVTSGYDKSLGLAVMKSAGILGLDDAASADLYRSLKTVGKKADMKKLDETKREEYAFAAERVLAAVLSFDIKALPGNGVSDLLADEQTYRMLGEISSMTPEVMKLTQNYRGIEAKGKVLSEKQLSIVEAICSLAESVKEHMDKYMPAAADAGVFGEQQKGKQFDALDTAYKELLKKADELPDEETRAALKSVDRKLKQTEQARRQQAEERLNVRIEAGLPAFVPYVISGEKLLEEYRQGYREREKYTQSRREEEMKTQGTDLFIKNGLAKQMTTASNRAKDKIARARRMISFNVRMGLSDEQFKDLSAFFQGNTSDNGQLVRSMLKDREYVYRVLTDRFLAISTDGLDLSNDREMAQNAERLEDISLKVRAYKNLMDSDPAFVKILEKRIVSAPQAKKQESLYDRVMLQMDRLGRLSDHYRVRKMVMTDAYYLSHYNDEIGLKAAKNANPEHRRLSKLLEKSRETATVLESQISGKNEPVQWTTSGSSEVITAMEEEHKNRPLASGRFDTTLVTKDTIKSLLREMKDFREKYPVTDIKRGDYNEIKTLAKGYSKRFQELIDQIYESQRSEKIIAFDNKLMPGVYDRVRSLAKTRGDHNRLSGYDDALKFEDLETGDSFSYGSNIDRDYTYFAQAGSSQMSEEELLEIFEGMDAANWKDVDYSDPAQVAAAKEMYLKNHAKIYQVFSNEQRRMESTYGMLPMQLPPLACAMALNGSVEAEHRLMINNTVEDITKNSSAKSAIGQDVNMLDYLVQKGYLSKEYVDKGRQTGDLCGGNAHMVNNLFIGLNSFFSYPEDIDEFVLDPVILESFADEINAHRGQQMGPEMTEAEERGFWSVCSSQVYAAGLPEMGVKQHESNIRAIQSRKNYTRSMAKLKRYIDNLASADTSGHSTEYRQFDASLNSLLECYTRIAAICPADGKNLDPQSMIELRRAYDKAIRAAKTYLKPKKMDHRNDFYRRRYEIVDELIRTMEKDSVLLGEKFPDKSYSLEECVEDSREIQITVSKGEIKTVGAALNKRKVIPANIDGEMRNWVFTERNAAGKKPLFARYGISEGSNLDMRNVAMSIMASELGTQNNIARSTISRVRIEEGENTIAAKGTMMEYIDGLIINDVKTGLINGDIIADNEPALIEQMSDIQVTDYLCGNVDRHLKNVMFEMEDTGRTNKSTGKKIRKIRRIVGIDNDLSFGTMLAQNIKRNTKKMSIPETMHVISRRTSDRILALRKEPLFLALGSTLTLSEKEALWTRVEHMQTVIMNASQEKEHTGLTITDDFSGYSVSDLAGISQDITLYRMFYDQTLHLGQYGISPDEDHVPHRLNAEEVRVDIEADGSMADSFGDEWGTLYAINLYRYRMKVTGSSVRKMDAHNKKEYLEMLYNASAEFNDSIGSFFDSVSTRRNYGVRDVEVPALERMDLFSNDYARSHGVDSILDIFFIGDRPAREVLPPIDDIVAALEADPVSLKRMIRGLDKGSSGGKVVATDADRLAFRDMVAKAYLMAYIVSGRKQVTIANYQMDKKGKDELAITDINMFVHAQEDMELMFSDVAGNKDNAKLIVPARKNRKERFAAIREQVEARRKGRKS